MGMFSNMTDPLMQAIVAQQANAPQGQPTPQQGGQQPDSFLQQAQQAVQSAGAGLETPRLQTGQGGVIENRPPAVGFKEHVKSALTNFLYSLGQGSAYAMTESGQRDILRQHASAAMSAEAQRQQELGMASGRMYSGLGAQARGQASLQNAGTAAARLNMMSGKFTYGFDKYGRVFDYKTGNYLEGGGKALEGVLPAEVVQTLYPNNPELANTPLPLELYNQAIQKYTSQAGFTPTMEGVMPTSKLTGKVTGPSVGQAPAAERAKATQIFANVAEGRLSLAQQAFDRDTFGTVFGKDIPSSLVDEQGNTIGWKSPSAPTSSIKTQAQQAQDLSTLFTSVRQAVLDADKSGKLGPYQGRIAEIMTGKVGADDPQFAELRALGSLTASGMLKAHFGARGGQLMYEHFQDLFNTGRMTSGDLLGALRGFQTFMNQYAQRVQTSGSQSRANVAGPASPKGMVTMTGPKGTFHVPASQVEVFTKNGYTKTKQQ